MAISEKPPGGDDHAGYSFRAMAQDQVEVMAALGFDKFYAAGHDRGARVLHRMCLDHPEKVGRAAILDIIPQHHLYNHINKQWATFSWHWFFNIQPFDLPERMMGADPDWFIEKKLAKTKQGLGFFDPEALAEYKRCFRNPETIHAICEDYRASSRCRSGDGRKRFCRGPQDRMSSAPVMGRNRGCWAQPQSGPCGNLAQLREQYRCRQGRPLGALPVRRSAGRNYGRPAGVFCRQILIDQIAVGLGMSRKWRTACQNKWRLIATATEWAVFGKITSCLSPCGSCR